MKKCRDCLLVEQENIPVCNFHQGYEKGRKEIITLIEKFQKKFKFQGKQGQPITYHKTFIDARIKEILEKLE